MGGGGKHYRHDYVSKIEIQVPEPVKNKTIEAKTNKKKRKKKEMLHNEYDGSELNNLAILGNGNPYAGGIVKDRAIIRLFKAREKHTEKEWQAMNVIDAFNALQEEVNEVKYAIEHEGEERMQDELLDVIAVAVRMLNHEYGD